MKHSRPLKPASSEKVLKIPVQKESTEKGLTGSKISPTKRPQNGPVNTIDINFSI